MANPKFTVDTHLFRELGELLVGRDSTAVVELIKNSYDADATKITVIGEQLDDPKRARIVIADDGNGMTPTEFNDGFLRVASRLKEEGDRRSKRFHRRYTGAKGIGRLAAHKLASHIMIESIPAIRNGELCPIVKAAIDWNAVEAQDTLDDLENSDAISVEELERPRRAQSGTTVTLHPLRRKWTPSERANFFAEVQTFSPPEQLVELTTIPKNKLLFERAKLRDSSNRDPGFLISLLGDFESGESYWQALAQAAQWVLEIDALSDPEKVEINIVPTRQGEKEFPEAARGEFQFKHPATVEGPFFQARILVREGARGNTPQERTWYGRSSGIRVYMEGFRVLPYGEPNDDWLSIDADYRTRSKSLQFLPEFNFGPSVDSEEGLLRLPKAAYFGGIFLMQAQAPTLRMLVNREGFVPDAGFLRLVDILRTAINLSIRQRAAAKRASREERSEVRREQAARAAKPTRLDLRAAVEASVSRAKDNAHQARKLAAAGDIKGAAKLIEQAATDFAAGSSTSERLITEGSILRVLASVGTQMAAFVHEIHQLLATARSLEQGIDRLRHDATLSYNHRSQLGRLHAGLGELRRAVERQASYLTDVASPDARRRRSRQRLAERFDAACRLIQSSAEAREIEVINAIPPDLRSPPMFPAEITLVFSNLLTNAVKAAGKRGRIRAKARLDGNGDTRIRIENTGAAVKLADAERWFRPFESTTVSTDPVLGQGMGLGLPITRNMLEDYGATIRFVEPSGPYSAALEIIFPK